VSGAPATNRGRRREITTRNLVGALLLLPIFVFACGGAEETPVESAEEEAGVEEVAKPEPESPAPTPAPQFESEHVDLESGDTATWRNGFAMTISEVHISPNASKQEIQQKQEENRASFERPEKKSPPPPDSPSPNPIEERPDELIAYHWHVQNAGTEPVYFRSQLPCEALDENGIALQNTQGSSAPEREGKAKAGPKVLEQPLESGQEREGWSSVIPPTEDNTFKIVCVQPPRAGQQTGGPKIAEAPETFKASWLINVPSLERRG
jgi:hypothetical protein